ncbi:MAG: T9SS type A sorting domain-containing protein, partial [Bacteroidota bacterium]
EVNDWLATFTSAFAKDTIMLDSSFNTVDEIRLTQSGTATNDYILDEIKLELAPFTPDPMDISLSAGTLLCNGDSTSLIARTVGGCLNYTYTWSTGDTEIATTALSDTLLGVTAGTYTVTVTDYNGSVDSATITITSPSALSTSAVVDSNISCNGFLDGGMTAMTTGGTPPYSYLWSNTATTTSITGVAAGGYTVSVTDANGCITTDSSTVTEPTILQASVLVDSNATCNGFPDAGMKANATGGTTPYNYIWNNTAITASITGVVAGTYTVTITDANGCMASDSSTSTEPASLTLTTFVDSNATCTGFADGGATVSVTGGTTPYNYLWNNSATTASITGVAEGTYTVTVTDANGCTSNDSGTITASSNISAAVVVDSNASCNGFLDGGLTASGSNGIPPYTYQWNNSATTAAITGVASGSYTVTITDANGCIASASGTVTEPAILTAQFAIDAQVSCNGLSDGILSVSGQGGTAPYTFLWSNADTATTISNLSAGNYGMTITDANGCTGVGSETITEPAVLTVAVLVDESVSCNGLSDGSLNTLVSGGTAPYTYSWSNGSASASATNLAAGMYTANVSDDNGCTASDDETITEPAPLVADIFINANVSCFGLSNGEMNALITGGTAPYDILWSTGENTESIEDLEAGFYEINVSDENGCSAFDEKEITEPTALVAEIIVDQDISCFGLADGQLSAGASGGIAPYNFEWDNEFVTETYTDLSAGTYQLEVRDANNCGATRTGEITEPDLLILSAEVTANASCLDNSDGQAIAAATGGVAPYTYEWSGGESNPTLSGVLAGDYIVAVTDNNGCTEQQTVEIVVIDTIAPTIMTRNITMELAGTGFTELDPNMVDDGSFDDCGIEAISVTPKTFSCINMGETVEVVVGVIDENGNTAFGKANVFIQDINTDIVLDGATATLTANEVDADYQWIDCGRNRSVEGAKGATFTPTISGDYAVIIQKYGCERQSNCVSVTALSTGITSMEQSISLYPNPTSGTYTLALPEVWTKVEVTLSSPTGQILDKQTYDQAQNIESTITLPAGVYFVKVQADGVQPVTFKVRKE